MGVCVWIWGDDAQKLAEYQNQNQNRPELTWLLLLRFLTHAGLSVKQSLAEMFPLQPKTTRGDQGCAEKRGRGILGETGCGGANLVLHHGFQSYEMRLQEKIPQNQQKPDEFLEIAAGTRGNDYLESAIPIHLLQIRISDARYG